MACCNSGRSATTALRRSPKPPTRWGRCAADPGVRTVAGSLWLAMRRLAKMAVIFRSGRPRGACQECRPGKRRSRGPAANRFDLAGTRHAFFRSRSATPVHGRFDPFTPTTALRRPSLLPVAQPVQEVMADAIGQQFSALLEATPNTPSRWVTWRWKPSEVRMSPPGGARLFEVSAASASCRIGQPGSARCGLGAVAVWSVCGGRQERTGANSRRERQP